MSFFVEVEVEVEVERGCVSTAAREERPRVVFLFDNLSRNRSLFSSSTHRHDPGRLQRHAGGRERRARGGEGGLLSWKKERERGNWEVSGFSFFSSSSSAAASPFVVDISGASYRTRIARLLPSFSHPGQVKRAMRAMMMNRKRSRGQ